MLKKILTCFSLLLVLTFSATVYAKPAELTGINAFELDNETVRIEISYRGQLDASDISSEFSLENLRFDIDNALPGRVSRIAGIEIESSAKKLIEKILVNKTKERRTSIQIHFKPIFKNGNSTFHLEPADRSAKKDARLVVDVKKIVAQDDWSTANFSGEKIIVLDPGHGGSDAGAIGPTGVTEKSVSLAVSLKARNLLTQSGYQVVMTRTTDVDVAAPGVSDATELQARVDKAPPNAALFISVHCNAFSNGKANGVETYHAPTAVKGARLARLLNEELARLGGLNNRGVKAARFYVMTHSQCPASLIELGFITNPREEKLLASDDYQQKLAQAITNAVNRYFNQGGFD
ncbi:MAG: N-acetylmuramoyl-L-alanine amidase [Selenomonadaceae bacterium]|nr:N-acetylmuramoyl-L-alanine amidase [Selenomonadaceae bacterium]